MPVEVIMPKVDMDMASGKVMTWHVAEGARVRKGAALFDIETDKAAMEVEAEADGFLHHRVPEGTEAAIGAPIGWLYAEGEAVGPAPTVVQPIEVERETLVAPTAQIAPVVDEDKPRATPRARTLAREHGVDLASLKGTGPRGRVQGDDIAAPSSEGALAVTQTPGEGVPIVLIHGFASDALSWAPLEQSLKGRPLIRIELPAHGKSPNLPVPSFAALATEIRRCFNALDLKSAHLVGHSLGGALSLALADTRPRKVASLFLIAPAGLGPEINGPALEGITKATRAESLGPWLRTLVADERLITDAYIRLAMAGRGAPIRAAQHTLADALFPDGVQAFDLRAALARARCPTTLLWGKRDRIIPWRHALGAPGEVALHLFEGVGHIPQIEIPETVGKLLNRQI